MSDTQTPVVVYGREIEAIEYAANAGYRIHHMANGTVLAFRPEQPKMPWQLIKEGKGWIWTRSQ